MDERPPTEPPNPSQAVPSNNLSAPSNSSTTPGALFDPNAQPLDRDIHLHIIVTLPHQHWEMIFIPPKPLGSQKGLEQPSPEEEFSHLIEHIHSFPVWPPNHHVERDTVQVDWRHGSQLTSLTSGDDGLKALMVRIGLNVYFRKWGDLTVYAVLDAGPQDEERNDEAKEVVYEEDGRAELPATETDNSEHANVNLQTYNEAPARAPSETGEVDTASGSEESFHSAQEESDSALPVYDDGLKDITGPPRPDEAAKTQRRSDFQAAEQARTPEQHATCERAIRTVRQLAQAIDGSRATEGARTPEQPIPVVRGRGNIGTWVPDPLPSEDESEFDDEGKPADRIHNRIVPIDQHLTGREAFAEDEGSEGVPASEIEAPPTDEPTTDAGELLALRILPFSDHDTNIFLEGVSFGHEIAAHPNPRAASTPLTGLATSPAGSAPHDSPRDSPAAVLTALPGSSGFSPTSAARENDSSDTRRTFGEDRDSDSITRGLYGSGDSDSSSEDNPRNALPLRGSTVTESAWRAEAGDTSGPAYIQYLVALPVLTAVVSGALARYPVPAASSSNADIGTAGAGIWVPSLASSTLSLATLAAPSIHGASTMANPPTSNANPSISEAMVADSSTVSLPDVNAQAGLSDHQPNTSGSAYVTTANPSTGVARHEISSAGSTNTSVRETSTVPNASVSNVNLGAMRDDAEVGSTSATLAAPRSSTQTGPSYHQAGSSTTSPWSSAAPQASGSTQASAKAIAPNPTDNVPHWSIRYPRADRRPSWQQDREAQRHVPSTRATFGNSAYNPQHDAGLNTNRGMRAPERFLNAENNSHQPQIYTGQFNTNLSPDPSGRRSNPRNDSTVSPPPPFAARPSASRASNPHGSSGTPSPYPTVPRTALRGHFALNTYISPYLRQPPAGHEAGDARWGHAANPRGRDRERESRGERGTGDTGGGRGRWDGPRGGQGRQDGSRRAGEEDEGWEDRGEGEWDTGGERERSNEGW